MPGVDAARGTKFPRHPLRIHEAAGLARVASPVSVGCFRYLNPQRPKKYMNGPTAPPARAYSVLGRGWACKGESS
jgi:hypothetical protein